MLVSFVLHTHNRILLKASPLLACFAAAIVSLVYALAFSGCPCQCKGMLATNTGNSPNGSGSELGGHWQGYAMWARWSSSQALP